MTNRHAVLLTSTIAPKPPFDKGPRSNPVIRLNDYKQSLKYWANVDSNYISSIVFCDNSGYDLVSLKCFADSLNLNLPVEFLSFQSSPLPNGMHYGFSELELISYALRNSYHLSQAPTFVKATGRLRFNNIDALIIRFPSIYDAIVDCRGIHRHEVGIPIRVRTQIMFFNRQFFLNHIDPLVSIMPLRRDSHLEEFMAYCLLKANCETDSDKIFYRFPVGCNPVGISGSGYNYGSLSSLLKITASNLIRRFLPSLYA